MGTDRKDKLGKDDPVGSGQQHVGSPQETSKRLGKEAEELCNESKRLIAEAKSLRTERSGWVFTVTCANGHNAEQPAFDRSSIAGLLRRDEPIPLYCPVCDRFWNATPEDREKLAWILCNSL